MSASVTWSGLDELKAALRALPGGLGAEGGQIVERAAQDAAQTIVAAYPERTGDLKKHVRVVITREAFGTSAVVQSLAKHASLYEYGTQARHTALGANRGAMPPRAVVVPTAVRRRREMLTDLIGLVRRQGLQVDGG